MSVFGQMNPTLDIYVPSTSEMDDKKLVTLHHGVSRCMWMKKT